MTVRQKREDMAEVHIMTNHKNFKAWTQWMPVMGPGFRLDVAQLNIPDSCGIYEMAVSKNQFAAPVYIGSTCRCQYQCQNPACGLRTRTNEYCRGESHKKQIIAQFLNNGFTISVRVREVSDDVREWQMKEQAARQAENELLQRYDYAWNIRSNGKVQARLIDLPENNRQWCLIM